MFTHHFEKVNKNEWYIKIGGDMNSNIFRFMNKLYMTILIMTWFKIMCQHTGDI